MNAHPTKPLVVEVDRAFMHSIEAQLYLFNVRKLRELGLDVGGEQVLVTPWYQFHDFGAGMLIELLVSCTREQTFGLCILVPERYGNACDDGAFVFVFVFPWPIDTGGSFLLSEVAT